ncbi:MAG: iron ABC transporter permease [Desulfobacteraceae bacterium]|nr:iron ABC transporter permease [Desulfobacteraceae bacterium]
MISNRFLYPLLLGGLLLTVLLAFSLGRYPVSPAQIFGLLAHELLGINAMDAQSLDTAKTVIVHIRMPRIVGAMLVGAALSMSGAVLQAVFINPLVSPKLVGILAGASFGAALGTVLSLSWAAVQACASIFGIIGVLVAVGIAGLYRGDKILLLVLGGIISSELFMSLFYLMKYLADPYSQLPTITYWFMGGFALADAGTVLVLSVPILLGIAALVLLSPYLNVLTMGEEEARTMGINATVLRTAFVIIAAVLGSLTVAVCGMLGWVGLVIPHMTRMLVGPNNQVFLPVTAVLGAIFLLIVDSISRLLFQIEIPLGILTALVGVPVFALVLRNATKGWSRWS